MISIQFMCEAFEFIIIYWFVDWIVFDSSGDLSDPNHLITEQNQLKFNDNNRILRKRLRPIEENNNIERIKMIISLFA